MFPIRGAPLPEAMNASVIAVAGMLSHASEIAARIRDAI
jgi:hypothetical protein